MSVRIFEVARRLPPNGRLLLSLAAEHRVGAGLPGAVMTKHGGVTQAVLNLEARLISPLLIPSIESAVVNFQSPTRQPPTAVPGR